MNNNDFEKLAGQLARSAVTGETLPENLVQIKAAFVGSPAGRYLLGGLGGAGIGALIGATQGRNKKRNALYYGTLGGLGGLGLAHFMNSGNSAVPATPAASPAAQSAAPPPSAAAALNTPETAAVAPKPAALLNSSPPAKDAPPSERVSYSANQEWLQKNPWAHPALFQGGKPNIPRVPDASKLRHDKALTPFENWLQTGKSTDAWYDMRNVAGDVDDKNSKKFEEILRAYYEKTKTPATSLDDLAEIGYIPENLSSPFRGVLNAGAGIQPQHIRDVNAMRQTFVPTNNPLHGRATTLGKGPLSFARAAQLLGLSPEEAFKYYQEAANSNRDARVNAWTGGGGGSSFF
jgi:hypothetical protein